MCVAQAIMERIRSYEGRQKQSIRWVEETLGALYYAVVRSGEFDSACDCMESRNNHYLVCSGGGSLFRWHCNLWMQPIENG